MAEVAESMEAVKPQLTPDQLVVRDDSEYATLFDTARFNQAWRISKAFASSKLVPAHFQGSPENCFLALDMAVRMNLHPFMLMQKLYVVQGRPGIEAQLLIALVNSRGPFRGPIQYKEEGEGDNRQWTAYATHKITGEVCEATVTWEMVKKEGWASKNGSKWLTLPGLMGRYRAATFLARLYCPEVILGLSTVDELQDVEVIEVESCEVPSAAEPKPTQTDRVKDKVRRLRKAPEPPQEAITPEPEQSTAPEQNSSPTASPCPRAATEEQIKEIEAAPDFLRQEGYQAFGLSPDLPVAELDQDTAQQLCDWLRAK